MIIQYDGDFCVIRLVDSSQPLGCSGVNCVASLEILKKSKPIEIQSACLLSKLKNIETLLLDFLKVILHPDNNLLNVSVVRLGASRVDLTSHLLSDET